MDNYNVKRGKGRVPRVQLNITKDTFDRLDPYRLRIGDMTESWDKFLARLADSGLLKELNKRG